MRPPPGCFFLPERVSRKYTDVNGVTESRAGCILPTGARSQALLDGLLTTIPPTSPAEVMKMTATKALMSLLEKIIAIRGNASVKAEIK